MNPTEQAMSGVIEETLASLAFMFPVDSDAPGAPEAGAMRRATVEFSGAFGGRLLVAVSPEMLEPLAANMLGLEDGARPSPEQQQDALRELLNVICGNLLPKIASPREVFDVHEPRHLAERDDTPPAIGLRDAGTVAVDLDSGRIQLTLWAEDAVTAAAPSGREQL